MIHTRAYIPTLILTMFFLFIISPGCTSVQKDELEETEDSSKLLANFRIQPEGDSTISNRAFEQVPAIAASENGDVLFVAWYSGGAVPGPGNFVTVSTSADQGESWINDQLVVFPKSPSTRIFDPALWRDHDGQVRLYYGSVGDSVIWDGIGGVNSVDISMDGSQLAYSNPKRLTDGVMSNKPIYIQSKNLTLMPVYVDKPANGTGNDKKYPDNGAFVFANEKNGLTKYSAIVVPDSLRIHEEPQLVEISPEGSFLALVRTTKGIYAATSSDYGKSWSEPKPFTAAGPTTSARFYIGKLSSGNLLLVANNSTARKDMTASVSKDGGKTWPYQLLLDSRDNVSYPDADQTPDGFIHVVFDRDRTGAKDILYCRFTEEDILKGLKENVFIKRVNQ